MGTGSGAGGGGCVGDDVSAGGDVGPLEASAIDS